MFLKFSELANKLPSYRQVSGSITITNFFSFLFHSYFCVFTSYSAINSSVFQYSRFLSLLIAVSRRHISYIRQCKAQFYMVYHFISYVSWPTYYTFQTLLHSSTFPLHRCPWLWSIQCHIPRPHHIPITFLGSYLYADIYDLYLLVGNDFNIFHSPPR